MNDYKERTIICEHCGKTLTKRMRAGRRFCSLECYRTSPKPERKNGSDKACEQCGKGFYVSANRQDARYCSLECQIVWQGRNKLEYTCENCGTTFRKSASHEKHGKIRYCSVPCRDTDPNHTAHLIELNVRQQTAKTNKLETAGYAILDILNAKYERQALIAKKFCVDALIESKHLIIQFDGDYWHANSVRFPVPDKRQRRRIALDKSQDAYLRKMGYTIIRIWEHDVRNSPEQVVRRLASILT